MLKNLIKYYIDIVERDTLERVSYPGFNQDKDFINFSLDHEWSTVDDQFVINLNQSISAFEKEQKKKEAIRWLIFTFIFSMFIANFAWFIQINNKIDNLIEKRKLTITKLINDTQNLQQSGQINLSKKPLHYPVQYMFL